MHYVKDSFSISMLREHFKSPSLTLSCNHSHSLHTSQHSIHLTVSISLILFLSSSHSPPQSLSLYFMPTEAFSLSLSHSLSMTHAPIISQSHTNSFILSPFLSFLCIQLQQSLQKIKLFLQDKPCVTFSGSMRAR